METQTTEHLKVANTGFPVMDLIRERWSPRSFSPEVPTEAQLQTLAEAASWAPSANNEQPWHFIMARKGTAGFDHLVETLLPGNKIWAQHAGALILSAVRTQFAANGNPNGFARHDLGMAHGFLALQAKSMDLYTHFMGGFDKALAQALLPDSPVMEAVAVIAVGYLGGAEQLEEPFLTREKTPRSRKEMGEYLQILN